MKIFYNDKFRQWQAQNDNGTAAVWADTKEAALREYKRMEEQHNNEKLHGCEACWHNYHCPLPQEGFDYDPDTCPYNPDNDNFDDENI